MSISSYSAQQDLKSVPMICLLSVYFVGPFIIQVGPPSPRMAHCNRIPGHRTGNFAHQQYYTSSDNTMRYQIFKVLDRKLCSILLKVVADKVERLIALLKLSKNTVVYTGIEPTFLIYFHILINNRGRG